MENVSRIILEINHRKNRTKRIQRIKKKKNLFPKYLDQTIELNIERFGKFDKH